jgi:hypothetical protein
VFTAGFINFNSESPVLGDSSFLKLMKGKRIKYLAACFTTSIVLLGFLYFFSSAIRSLPNGFTRLLPPHLLTPGPVKDTKYNSYYIAGLTKDSIYLANFTDPYIILSLDYDLKKSADRQIEWSNTIRISKGATISIDSPDIYLKDGLDQMLFKSRLENLNDITICKTPPYNAAVNINNQCWVYRCINTQKDNILVRQSLDQKTIETNSDLLQKQGDGIFSTDGVMIQIPNTTKWLYMYYYRNQFFCADSNLILIYRGKTIDTVSHAHISVSFIKSRNQIMMSSPPLLVNRNCSANKEYIFINSALNAENESHKILEEISIIDVYNVVDGKYKFSFYLPNFGGKKPSDFKVYQSTLVTIYEHYVVTYKLEF